MHLVVGDLNISPIVCFKPFGLSCHYLLIVTGLLLEAQGGLHCACQRVCCQFPQWPPVFWASWVLQEMGWISPIIMWATRNELGWDPPFSPCSEDSRQRCMNRRDREEWNSLCASFLSEHQNCMPLCDVWFINWVWPAFIELVQAKSRLPASATLDES